MSVCTVYQVSECTPPGWVNTPSTTVVILGGMGTCIVGICQNRAMHLTAKVLMSEVMVEDQKLHDCRLQVL